MVPSSLKELIQSVFSDEKVRVEFLENPESVVSRFNLTDQEKRALMATGHKVGLVTGDSLKLEAAIDPLLFWY